MVRAVVNYAVGNIFEVGQQRLYRALDVYDPDSLRFFWANTPKSWPTHQEKPYAFKAYALMEAAKHADVLLWCDASVVPIRDLTPLWNKIETDGYWIARNGWNNYEWTCEASYADLFPGIQLRVAREMNRKIPHVVATAFGLNLKTEIGASFLKEYYRLASQTNAFNGPWRNESGNCGPPDVLGHRHDQTAASVIAWRLGWRLGMKLTDCPEIFAYRREDGTSDERTILEAVGC